MLPGISVGTDYNLAPGTLGGYGHSQPLVVSHLGGGLEYSGDLVGRRRLVEPSFDGRV